MIFSHSPLLIHLFLNYALVSDLFISETCNHQRQRSMNSLDLRMCGRCVASDFIVSISKKCFEELSDP